MHIAILISKSAKKDLQPGTIALQDRGESMGHNVTILNENDLQIRFGTKPNLYINGKPLPRYDAVITRPLFTRDPSIHSALIRQFELNGYVVINGYLGIQRARNKIRTLQLLDHHQLPMPKTVVLFGPEQLEQGLQGFTFPVIVKMAYGAGGTGIFIAESRRSIGPLVEYLLKENPAKDPIKIQEYIKESKGKDLRVFVVGQKVVAAMQRSAKKGEFRANIHQGGMGKKITLTPEEIKLALDATHVMGLDIAGVDILRTQTGPAIIEVNSTPGLEGISLATGVDVAREILLYTEKRVRRAQQKSIKKTKEKRSKKEEA